MLASITAVHVHSGLEVDGRRKPEQIHQQFVQCTTLRI